MLSDLWFRLRALFRRAAMERELEEELSFHLDLQVEKYRQAGLPSEEAIRRARLDFGGNQQAREECRDARGIRWLEEFVQDLGYGFRKARANPTFTLTAVGTIALGIGASTAVFSVTHAVLLRPLPYPQSDRLILADPMLSNAFVHDLREGTREAIEEWSAVMVYRAVIPLEEGGAERISKGQVTVNFFRMMGARIAFGRDFTQEDAKPPSQAEPPFPPPEGRVAILSYEYFARRYGANPAILGSHMMGAHGPGPRIVGVAAPGFRLWLPERFTTEPSPDVWIANDRGYDSANRGALMLRAIGKRKEGAGLEQAQAQSGSSVWRMETARIPDGFAAVARDIGAGGPCGDSGLDGSGRFPPADRLCQRSEPADGSCGLERKGTGGTVSIGSRTGPIDSPDAGGIAAPGGDWSRIRHHPGMARNPCVAYHPAGERAASRQHCDRRECPRLRRAG